MDEEATKPEPEVSFEQSRLETRRAQWALNILVVFSAVAGSVFFFYVLYTIRPFGSKEPPPVDVPTSSVGPKFGMLAGTDEASGLGVVLRDIDEAPSYREQLSEVMRKDLGIERNGRMYLLIVRNDGEAPADVDAAQLTVRDGAEKGWEIQWLDQAASPASPTGKLRLTQSGRKFELAKGEERQLYVFIPSSGDSLPPSAEDLSGGSLKLTGGPDIPLSHTEIKAAQQ
ncbi:MAG: hypothetical protein H6840_03670 [Planctomycetes bacterium]|nr:hypothetical protein [Planctomycetota bacterium]